MAIQDTDCQPTDSKSVETNRRQRKPRNASSSSVSGERLRCDEVRMCEESRDRALCRQGLWEVWGPAII